MQLRENDFKISHKPWGQECLITKNDKYAFKKIIMKKGTRSSLQSHNFKLETIFVFDGAIELETYTQSGSIKEIYRADEAYTIPVGCKHRVFVIEDCILFEVSTPELDDVIRYEDDYGRTTQ